MGDTTPKHSLPQPPTVRPVHVGLAAGLAFLLICIVALAGFVIASNSATVSTRGGNDARELDATEAVSAVVAAAEPASSSGAGASSTQEPPERRDYDAADVVAIPGSDSVIVVDVAADPVEAQPCPFDVTDVNRAIADIEEVAACGFVFVNADTGRGIAYHADTVTYIASASKAVLAHYAVLHGARGEYENDIGEAIVYSDNDSYEAFGYAYADEGYGEWLEAHDAGFDAYASDLYPPMSARSLASFWTEMLGYIRDGSEDALWFGELLALADQSFIAGGIDDPDAALLNKAGWIGEDDYYSSVTDSAIIVSGNRTFIMTIVTGQPEDDFTEENVSALARALFALRDAF